MVHLEFVDDAAAFLVAARDRLEADPVVGTVVATMAEREVRNAARGVLPEPGLPHWYAVARDADGRVVGAAMRTAPFAPHPLFLLPMPEEAAVALGRALVERGEAVEGVNGALPAVRQCADEVAALTGATVEVGQHTRLFELGTLVPPEPVPGHLRVATHADADLARAWYAAFMHDADEQAGRPPGSSAHETPTAEDMALRIEDGRVFLWEHDDEVVHLTGANPPSFGVARIGPVYTPREQRGRGWASAAVAEVSRRVTADGTRACLFTDQANPTSNAIYQRLGYRAVVDMANLVLTRPASGPAHATAG